MFINCTILNEFTFYWMGMLKVRSSAWMLGARLKGDVIVKSVYSDKDPGWNPSKRKAHCESLTAEDKELLISMSCH